jgi:hypothetical protein
MKIGRDSYEEGAMKRLTSVSTLVLAVLLIGAASSAGAAEAPTFTLLNDLPATLAIGESYTIDLLVTSQDPFIYAQAMLNQYYPGRGIRVDGPDHAGRGTLAVLHITITGKNSTAELLAVNDWPETEDWPAGVVPLSIVAGCRYPGGEVFSQQFSFAVAVPWPTGRPPHTTATRACSSTRPCALFQPRSDLK